MILGQQHDHHCLLTFSGINWRILKCFDRGRKIAVLALDVYPPDAGIVTILDLRNADMEAYCEAAAAWNEQRRGLI